MSRSDHTTSLSAVVSIMLNKDKDVYLLESIENEQCITLSQPAEIQVKVFISWSDLFIMWSWKFQASGDFCKTCCLTSTLQFSPQRCAFLHQISSHTAQEFIISRTKYTALVSQNLDTICWLTSLHSTPHLTSLETYQMKTTGCSPLPFYVKSFWVRYL